MTIRTFIDKYDRQIGRFFEILPGLVTWGFITSPLWAGIFVPQLMAYLVIFVALYWLFQSARIARGIGVSFRQFKKDEARNWLTDCREFADFTKVQHLIIIPFCSEPLDILQKTLRGLTCQTFPKEQMHVVLAMEEFAGDEGRKKVSKLVAEFGRNFKNLWMTFHPRIPGETVGKSSNLAWAGKWAKKKLIDELGHDLDFVLVTSNDSDARLHSRYLSCVAYKFLSLPLKVRQKRFFQSAVVFYNNLWRVPLPIRVRSAASSVIEMGRLASPQDLHPYSTYTTSLKMIHQAGYWGTSVVPEDYHIFYKCFFHYQGEVDVLPIFLPTFADAAESTSFWKGLVNHYEQVRRWAYGVSDDPYVFKEALKHSEIPLTARLFRLLILFDFHFLWAAKSFIPFGSIIAPLINPTFQGTVLAYNLPRVASLIFKLCLLSSIILVSFDILMRPEHPKKYNKGKLFIISVFDWFFSPTIGLFFSVLPAIDAHTRLMLGRYLEYKVTEKVA